jgi:hypothetical protein
MKITYRWNDDIELAPMHGCYLVSPHRPRHGYLILSVTNKGRRGGLGSEFYYLLILEVAHVPVAEAHAAGDRCYSIVWDKREKKRRQI